MKKNAEEVKARISARISDTLSDLVSSFLYYDRKEDEDLPEGVIEKALEVGYITPEFLVSEFKTHLYEGLGIEEEEEEEE